MSTTTNLSTLKINYLSQAQYDEALANDQINDDELYFTPYGAPEIFVSSSDPTSSDGVNGDIWIKYTV